ncbi:hypothetical protein ACEPPN_018107 [Leptodophora sp. 'Broadleaf-Isolate-01']
MPPKKPTAKAAKVTKAATRARLPRAAKSKATAKTYAEVQNAESVPVAAPKVVKVVKKAVKEKEKEQEGPAILPPLKKEVVEYSGAEKDTPVAGDGGARRWEKRTIGMKGMNETTTKNTPKVIGKTSKLGTGPSSAAEEEEEAEALSEDMELVEEDGNNEEYDDEEEQVPLHVSDNASFNGGLLPNRKTMEVPQQDRETWLRTNVNPLYAGAIESPEDVVRFSNLVTKLGPGHPNVKRLFKSLCKWTGSGIPPTPDTFFLYTSPNTFGAQFGISEKRSSPPQIIVSKPPCGCGISRCTDGSICTLGPNYDPSTSTGRAARLFTQNEIIAMLDKEVDNVHLDCPHCNLIIRHGLPIPFPFTLKTKCTCTSPCLQASGKRANPTRGIHTQPRYANPFTEAEFEIAIRDKRVFLEEEIDFDVDVESSSKLEEGDNVPEIDGGEEGMKSMDDVDLVDVGMGPGSKRNAEWQLYDAGRRRTPFCPPSPGMFERVLYDIGRESMSGVTPVRPASAKKKAQELTTKTPKSTK